jgi:hypothetical protein
MRTLASCLLATVAAVSNSLRSTQTALAVKAEHSDSDLVEALSFGHRLRICNAYPFEAGVKVFLNSRTALSDSALNYKECANYQTDLKAGDKLEFRVGNANAGIFSVSDLPNNDAVLLLVIHRHDTLSTAVSFESHVFANLLNGQVAVIDTYKGASRSTLKIEDHDDAKTSRSEQLRFDSVVAVNPGKYSVLLQKPDGETKSKSELVALGRESYVVLRVGVDAQEGPSFPEELVVFPHSDEALLGGAAATSVVAMLAGVLMYSI